MRIGLMVGSDKERPRADRLTGLLDDGKSAESQGFASFWIPQVPGYLDAMTAVALLGQVTDRIEIGTAVVPIQTRHPLIMAQQALTTQVACAGRFTLGIGPSHHWIIDGSARTALRPACSAGPRLPRRAGRRVRRARPGGRGQRHLPGAQPGGRDRRVRDAGSDRRARAHDAADRGRAHRRNDPLDGRRAGDRRLRGAHASPKAATAAGRPETRVVAGVPVALCATDEVGDARAYASEVLGHADFSPNYVRLLEHGDAEDVGDTMAAGDESAVLARLCRYRDAGVTDLAVRVVPLGQDADTRSASRRRTQEFVASLFSEFCSGA